MRTNTALSLASLISIAAACAIQTDDQISDDLFALEDPEPPLWEEGGLADASECPSLTSMTLGGGPPPPPKKGPWDVKLINRSARIPLSATLTVENKGCGLDEMESRGFHVALKNGSDTQKYTIVNPETAMKKTLYIIPRPGETVKQAQSWLKVTKLSSSPLVLQVEDLKPTI